MSLDTIKGRLVAERTCSVDGCEKPVKSRGWCTGHWHRWRAHGHPLGGGPERGLLMRWVDDLLSEWAASQWDECRTDWPFTRDAYGYPKFGDGARVHAVILEKLGSNRPTLKHEVRHLCGHGHLGCLTPKHLKWGTRVENMADRVAHGTAKRGSERPNAKLTESDIVAIRASSERQCILAKRLGVDPSLISRVRSGEHWGWV